MRIASIATAAILASALGMAANSARADWWDDDKEPKGIIKCEKKYDHFKCDCKFIYDKKDPHKFESTYNVDVRKKDHDKIVAKCFFDYLRHPKRDRIEDFDCKLVIKDRHDYITLFTDDSVWKSDGRKALLKCKFEKDDDRDDNDDHHKRESAS
jgi:hypothetical protein